MSRRRAFEVLDDGYYDAKGEGEKGQGNCGDGELREGEPRDGLLRILAIQRQIHPVARQVHSQHSSFQTVFQQTRTNILTVDVHGKVSKYFGQQCANLSSHNTVNSAKAEITSQYQLKAI